MNACPRVLALMLAFGAVTAPARAAEPALRLRLIAGRTTYYLVDGGRALQKKLDDFRASPKGANRRLDPLVVDLTLQISNVTNHRVAFWRSSDDRTAFWFELKGPGVAVEVPYPLRTMEQITSPPVELAPGHRYRLRITRLSYDRRKQAYWTVPGRYTLTASFATGVKPVTAGIPIREEGFETVTLTSNPVTIDVRTISKSDRSRH